MESEESGTFEIVEASGHVFMTNTRTGEAWILRGIDRKTVWIAIDHGPKEKTSDE